MDFITLLKDKNLKVTPQRLTITQELYLNGHMNIDQIYLALIKKFPSISLATIYKNINTMLEVFFISEVKLPNQKNVYELMKEKHTHLVCKNCNEIIDIKLNIQNIVKEIEEKKDFYITSENLVFEGICQECVKKY